MRGMWQMLRSHHLGLIKYISMKVETRNVYKILIRKTGSTKPRMRLDVDGSVILKGILQKIRSIRTDWIHKAQDRLRVENSCQQGRELPGSLIGLHRKYD